MTGLLEGQQALVLQASTLLLHDAHGRGAKLVDDTPAIHE